MRKHVILSALFLATLIVLGACAPKEDITGGAMQGEEMKNEEMVKDGMENDHKAMNQGEPAPMFSLKDLNGNDVMLSDFKGEKVYVKYWASWCSICLSGLEDLDMLAGKENGFRVISIVTPNYKGEQSAEDFTKWFNSQPYDHMTVLLDHEGVWAREFGLRGYPSSYYIGSDGILAKSSPGHVDNETITARFEEIH
ncbi:redoxin family protein [Sutcliffiella halmapala]